MKSWFLALLLVGFVSCSSASKVKLTGETLLYEDKNSQAEIHFNLGEAKELVTYVCRYADCDGRPQYLGAHKQLSYLDQPAYNTFKTKYGGDQRNCPASFLNSKTRTVYLVGKDDKTKAALRKMEFEGKYGIEARFRGQPLIVSSAKAMDGSDWEIDLEGAEVFLVEEILKP